MNRFKKDYHSGNNFTVPNKLKSEIYNLGLSSANLTKLMLAKEIKKQLKYLKSPLRKYSGFLIHKVHVDY